MLLFIHLQGRPSLAARWWRPSLYRVVWCPPPPPPDDGRYVFLCGAGKVGTMLSWSRLTYDYVSISPAHATPHPSHLTLPCICTLGSQYTIFLFYLPYCSGFLNTSLWSFLKVPSFLTVAGTSFVFPYCSTFQVPTPLSFFTVAALQVRTPLSFLTVAALRVPTHLSFLTVAALQVPPSLFLIVAALQIPTRLSFLTVAALQVTTPLSFFTEAALQIPTRLSFLTVAVLQVLKLLLNLSLL